MTGEAPSHTALVVEDNPDIAVGLEDLLAHDGYTVHTAGSCAGALAQLGAYHFNEVLLDVTLPDGDGLEVLATIQQLDPHLPVVIVTASTATEKTVGSLTQGAFAYLAKPYYCEELRQTLRRSERLLDGDRKLPMKPIPIERLNITVNQKTANFLGISFPNNIERLVDEKY